MKTKKLKNLVKKAKNELSWPTREEVKKLEAVHIFSDPMARTHTIYHPENLPDEGPIQELLYLHELGHAILCERVHPFFSSGFPVDGLDKKLMPAVTPLLNVASDWFVGHWMMEFCQDVAMEELKKEYEATAEMMNKGETPSFDKFFVAVLIIAQSIKYLKAPVECSGLLDSAVQAFLEVPPEKPSLRKFEDLINALLSLGTNLHCRHVNINGLDVLEFYRD